MINVFKNILGLTRTSDTFEVSKIRNKICADVLSYLKDNKDEDDLKSSLYQTLTNTKFDYENFENLYNDKLKSKFKNMDLDDINEHYINFRKKLIELANKKKYNLNIQHMKYLLISSSFKNKTYKKKYLSLDNTSYEKYIKNLSFITNVINNFPYTNLVYIKIPMMLQDFIMRFDNFIVYYIDIKFEENINRFINSINKNIFNRSDFFRSDVGKDIDGESDTQIIINAFVNFLSNNKQDIINSININEIRDNNNQYKKFELYIIEILKKFSLNAEHRK